jgi:hypothetical protein
MRNSLFILLLAFLFASLTIKAQNKKGFDLSNSTIPVDKIVDGGPPRDGIPSIDDPNFIRASMVDFLEPNDMVLGVSYNYISKAYPVKILNWHEIVNDYFGKKPVAVTYCPLCGSGLAFEAHVAGKDRTFGVSGLLYNNDLLLYDRQSESLWSQIEGKAVSGPLVGTKLPYIQTRTISWKKWKQMYPYSQVLSTETGYAQNYDHSPYAGYEDRKQVPFPAENTDDRHHPKEWVLGIEMNGQYKVYPFSELQKAEKPIHDQFAGKTLSIQFEKDSRYTEVKMEGGEEYPCKIMYWFAWMAFHPESEVFVANGND